MVHGVHLTWGYLGETVKREKSKAVLAIVASAVEPQPRVACTGLRRGLLRARSASCSRGVSAARRRCGARRSCSRNHRKHRVVRIRGVEELSRHQPSSHGVVQRHAVLIPDVGRHHILSTGLTRPQLSNKGVVEVVASSIGVPHRPSVRHSDLTIAVISVEVVLELVVGPVHHTHATGANPLRLRN